MVTEATSIEMKRKSSYLDRSNGHQTPLTEPLGLHLPNIRDASWSFGKKVECIARMIRVCCIVLQNGRHATI